MHFANLGQSVVPEFAGEPDECGPDPPMHVSDLPVHEPADEHIRRIPHEASQSEDLMALRMTPPVSANALASRGVGESDHRSVSRLENDPMPFDKLHRGSTIHMRVHRITWKTWTQLA
jgi:hypothetical protein